MPALDGMKVLDMTQYEAGPSCTQVLAWFGADVVKVEPPDPGDGARVFGRDGSSGYSAFFCAWNANKRSLAVDLGSRQGRELLLRLAPVFDVFVENYGPGVIERFDIGYETLGAIHPGLIYVRIKGFGASGPYAGFHSVDPTAQAAAGGVLRQRRGGQTAADARSDDGRFGYRACRRRWRCSRPGRRGSGPVKGNWSSCRCRRR